jgi:hypothetical protein
MISDGQAGVNRQVLPVSAANQPFRWQISIREDVFVIGHGIVAKRLAGVGLLGAQRRQAGGRIVPGPEVD